MENIIQAHNGQQNWIETHHEIVSYITSFDTGVIHETQENEGIGGLWELGLAWTNEFEQLYSGAQWDGEFYDAVEKFVEDKNSGKTPERMELPLEEEGRTTS